MTTCPVCKGVEAEENRQEGVWECPYCGRYRLDQEAFTDMRWFLSRGDKPQVALSHYIQRRQKNSSALPKITTKLLISIEKDPWLPPLPDGHLRKLAILGVM